MKTNSAKERGFAFRFLAVVGLVAFISLPFVPAPVAKKFLDNTFFAEGAIVPAVFAPEEDDDQGLNHRVVTVISESDAGFVHYNTTAFASKLSAKGHLLADSLLKNQHNFPGKFQEVSAVTIGQNPFKEAKLEQGDEVFHIKVETEVGTSKPVRLSIWWHRRQSGNTFFVEDENVTGIPSRVLLPNNQLANREYWQPMLASCLDGCLEILGIDIMPQVRQQHQTGQTQKSAQTITAPTTVAK